MSIVNVKSLQPTLQATSIFMVLPPNRVDGAPGGLAEAPAWRAAVWDAFSQRCRNLVTSSWSSMVFMCLKQKPTQTT